MVKYIMPGKKELHIYEVMDQVNRYVQYGQEVQADEKTHYKNYTNAIKAAASFRRIRIKKETDSAGHFAICKNLVKRIIVRALAWYMRDMAAQQTQFNKQVVAALVAQQKMMYRIMQNYKNTEAGEKKC